MPYSATIDFTRWVFDDPTTPPAKDDIVARGFADSDRRHR